MKQAKIKGLAAIDQPREKLAKYGPEKLSNSELLAILLRTGSGELNVVQLAQKVLKKFSALMATRSPLPGLGGSLLGLTPLAFNASVKYLRAWAMHSTRVSCCVLTTGL